MNKKIYHILAIFIISFSNAQVAIGKSEVSKLMDNVTNNPSVSLEFYDKADNTRGLVLPWVSTVKNNPVTFDAKTGRGYIGMEGTVANGTIIFDLSDKKIKYRKPGEWFDLTGKPDFPLKMKNETNAEVTVNSFSAIDSSLQDNIPEQASAKVVIGKDGSEDGTVGILVLSDTDKAMVLPKVASPHLAIQNPAPGMIVFDTVKKQLAVYNGTVWSFWKP